jgi:iron transport multicopper oxidase
MLDCTTSMMVSVVTYCGSESADGFHFFQNQNLQSLLSRTGDDAHHVVVQGADHDRYRYHLPSSQVPVPFISNSTLINGLGRYQGGPSSPLSVVNVQFGKRYRFRLVSVACDSFFTFSIDGHNMTIIEADGVNTEPLTVDSLQIFSAQRYSFILHAKEKVGNFWIRAVQRPGADGGPPGFVGGINSAILRYTGAPEVDPTTTQTPSVIPLNEGNLHPLINPRAPGRPYPGGADISFNLIINITGQGLFTINNVSFVPPSVPVLLQILSGSTQASQLLPKGSVFPLPLNKVVEISLPALGVPAGPVSILLYFPTNNTHPRSFSILSTSTE